MVGLKMITLQFHDLAAAFPMMEPPAFEELCKDIQSHGLKVPIVLYDGKILDGRNRYNACLKTGTAIRTESYTGLDPLGCSYSLNAIRRHLTPDQKKAAVTFKLTTTPEKSNATIAKEVHVDHKEVAKVRKILEQAGVIPDTTTQRAAAGAAAGAKGASDGAKGASAGAKGGRPKKDSPPKPKEEPAPKPKVSKERAKPVPDEDGYWSGRKYEDERMFKLKITARGQRFVPDRAADRHMMEQWSNWFHDKDKRIHMRPSKKDVESLVQAMNWVGVHYGTPWDVVECACKYLRGYYHETKETADPYKFMQAVKSYDLLRKTKSEEPNFFPDPTR